MQVASFIARRISLKPTDDDTQQRHRSPGSIIAIVGIALSIAIMIIAVAVVTGFKQEIRSRITGFNAPIVIYPADAFSDSIASRGIRLDSVFTNQLHQLAPKAEVSLSLNQSAIFKTDDAFQGIVLRSTNSPEAAAFVEKNLVRGHGLPTQAEIDADKSETLINSVVISLATARALNIDTADRITAHFQRDGTLATRRLDVVGIYDTHFSEYDRTYAFTPQSFLQRLVHVDSITGSSVELRGISPFEAPVLGREIDQALLMDNLQHDEPRKYITTDVMSTCSLYFNWLDLLDTNVVVIIVLMALVASFTLISSLFIIILERVKMIGLLKTLGATNRLIRKIFIILAQRLVLRGLLWGNFISLGFIYLQHRFHIMPLDPESYYLDFVPTAINATDILIINSCAIVISVAVLIIPSQFIARLLPAETVRFE